MGSCDRVGRGAREHPAVVGANCAGGVAVGGCRQGDVHGRVAVGFDGDGPVLVGALLSPFGVFDVAAYDGECVVADPLVAGLDVLAEGEFERELGAAVVSGWARW